MLLEPMLTMQNWLLPVQKSLYLNLPQRVHPKSYSVNLLAIKMSLQKLKQLMLKMYFTLLVIKRKMRLEMFIKDIPTRRLLHRL